MDLGGSQLCSVSHEASPKSRLPAHFTEEQNEVLATTQSHSLRFLGRPALHICLIFLSLSSSGTLRLEPSLQSGAGTGQGWGAGSGKGSFANPMFIQFFCFLRKDSPPPPRSSLKVSPSELTAGAPELDTLLTVHLQVCKALLQVSGWSLAGLGVGLKGGEKKSGVG